MIFYNLFDKTGKIHYTVCKRVRCRKVMKPIEEYLPKAVFQEVQFLQSRREEGAQPLQRDQHHPAHPATVPEAPMFHQGEMIVVKIHATPSLQKAYLPEGQLIKAAPKAGDGKGRPFIHRHDFFEFNYIERGMIKNHLEPEPLIHTPQQILLMNPYAIHSPQPVEDDTVLFNILIEREWVEQVFTSLLSFHQGFFNFFLDSIYGLNRMTPYLVLENTPELTSIFHQMIAEYFEKKDYYQQMLFSKLIELFALLSRHQSDSRRKKDVEFLQQRDIADILSYLRGNYTHITLAKAAEFFNYTPNYLSKLIKRHTGRHFSEIIQGYKLESACNYLVHSSLSIEKINEIIGYNDASYFSKVFHKKYGVSPNRYRQIHSEARPF